MAHNKKKVDFSLNCSVCSNSFKEQDIITVEKQEERTVMHATCSKCRTSALLFFLPNAKGIVSVGMITDLDRKEVKNIFGNQVIGIDEVLDVHNLVYKF